MKKIICMIIAICLIMSMAACTTQKEIDGETPNISTNTDSEATKPTDITISSEATSEPTVDFTTEVTTEPTTEPTTAPITEPTTEPTTVPTTVPTVAPTEAPTEPPATNPTNEAKQEESPSTTITTPAPTEHQHAYVTTVVEPTCTDGGFTVDHCDCGANNVYNSIPALGHTFGEWVTTIEPTTTANGQSASICSECNYQEFESIEKLAACETHDWVVTEKETVDAYPLRHYGYVTTACSVCGEKKGTEARYFTPDNIDYATEVSTIISLVNAMRASEGLSQLTTSGEWNDWAAIRAQEISVYYAHSRPNGASFGRNNGVDMAYGENIAKNANSGADFYYGFLNSPQHCGLMKTPDATGIAVSLYVNEYGDSYCAMVIYGPMGM